MKKVKDKKVIKMEKKLKKNKVIRRIKKLGFKGIIKEFLDLIIKNTIYLIVGLLYAIYLLIRTFDNLVVKLFMKIPRIVRVVIIYSLVINLSLDVYAIYTPLKEFIKSYNTEEKVSVITPSELKIEEVPMLTETTQNETKEEEVKECFLEHETACKIKNKAEEYGIDWKIAVSISKWETGNFTSNLYFNKNNVGGMYCNGSFLSYATLDEGIEAYVSNLKRLYFDMGLDTLEEIQKKYCPIGAKNDPKGLNKNWLGGVTKIYNSLEK
ncbi:MAG: glucosaminidase domain-containing protein [Acutalibacteraceae bacterium]|nr:glucosaminidase domain-containing protein [Acutalibacteraceae bacterium]